MCGHTGSFQATPEGTPIPGCHSFHVRRCSSVGYRARWSPIPAGTGTPDRAVNGSTPFDLLRMCALSVSLDAIQTTENGVEGS